LGKILPSHDDALIVAARGDDDRDKYEVRGPAPWGAGGAPPRAIIGERRRRPPGIPRRRAHPRSHRGHRKRRSTAPSNASKTSAMTAEGIAPARIRRLSSDATPLKTSVPSPPAPIGAAMVASPTPMTVATRTPAR